MRTAIALCILSLSASLFADDPIPADPPLRWFKGNLHTHSLWSDGNDFPEMIAEWYRTHEYHFLALSDHNILSEGPKWMKHEAITKRGGKEALAKYRARFGGGWVETRGTEGESDFDVRLKPLSEFRALVEERGRFLMIPSEEITDKAEGVPVHLNAANVVDIIQPLGGLTVREAIAANVRAVEEQSKKRGREMMVHLNHPNFGFAITAEDLAEVISEHFFEIYNGHPGVNQQGDSSHASVEKIWDIANTIRVARLDAPPLFGIATDDSHEYHGASGSHPGRGWIMVQSRYLTPEHLLRAIKAGNFYASSGVSLKGFSFDSATGEYRIEIAGKPGVQYTTDFVGTLADSSLESEPATDKEGKPIRATRKYSGEIGKTLATVGGETPSYRLTGKELYVRAIVTSSQPPADPSFKGQKQQAWVQPVVPPGRLAAKANDNSAGSKDPAAGTAKEQPGGQSENQK